jgi:DNA/RNA-binding domain of Phe-tRNA-synthetase-like protein
MHAIEVQDHPQLELGALGARTTDQLGELHSPEWLLELLSPEAESPLRRDEASRAAVRDLLRHGGYKPTGRGKPSSEYLVRAADEGRLSPINPAVDLCNVVSLHSGLPISVVDAELVSLPLLIGLAPEGSTYVFNASGQEIKVDGLLCLQDVMGPCANAVKDAQRTKTSPTTRELLYLVWGTRELPGQAQAALEWLAALADRVGFTSIERGC